MNYPVAVHKTLPIHIVEADDTEEFTGSSFITWVFVDGNGLSEKSIPHGTKVLNDNGKGYIMVSGRKVFLNEFLPFY